MPHEISRGRSRTSVRRASSGAPRPGKGRTVPPIDAEPMRLRGVPQLVILLYVRAVEAAWAQAAQQLRENGRGPAQRPLIVLRSEHPIVDPRTVRASVGVDGELGTVAATSPGALREVLARHLAERFGTA